MPKSSWKLLLKQEFFSLSGFFSILIISSIYVIFSFYLLNYRFAFEVITNHFPFLTKISLITSLIGGIFTSISPLDLLLLFITSLLVGINIYLGIKTINLLENNGKVKVSIGGSAVIGLVTTGCASCGFSLFSILGLSATFSFLPFHGLELHITAIILLIVSVIYMLNQLHKSKYCLTVAREK